MTRRNRRGNQSWTSELVEQLRQQRSELRCFVAIFTLRAFLKNVSPEGPKSLIPVAVTVLSMLFHRSPSLSDSLLCSICRKRFQCTFSCSTSRCFVQRPRMFVYVFQCLKCTCLECVFCFVQRMLKCFTYAILKCKHKEGKNNKGKHLKTWRYFCVKALLSFRLSREVSLHSGMTGHLQKEPWGSHDIWLWGDGPMRQSWS